MSCLLRTLSKTLLQDTTARRLSELDSAEKLRVEQDLEVGSCGWVLWRGHTYVQCTLYVRNARVGVFTGVGG